MKNIANKDLEPGMILAETVKTRGGQVIAKSGTVLTKQLILHMGFYNIESVAIVEEENNEEPTTPKTNTSDSSYSQKIRSSKKFQAFQIDYSVMIQHVHEAFENYVDKGIPLPSEQLLEETTTLYHSCRTTIDLFDMLHNMRSVNDSTYAHCLNVALICRIFGKWLKVDRKTQDVITLCGLYHDIGKLKIPDAILNKPGKYTDDEFALVKKHPQFSYDLLKDLPLDSHVKNAALMHHERCDGSGYPGHLTTNEIDNYAMIVAVADVYDAMTAARSYRAPLCPFQVIENFEKDGLSKYMPKYILTFLERIANTYQSQRVLLSNGQSANIVFLNKQKLSRPMVQLNDNSCIDLSTADDLHIQALL